MFDRDLLGGAVGFKVEGLSDDSKLAGEKRYTVRCILMSWNVSVCAHDSMPNTVAIAVCICARRIIMGGARCFRIVAACARIEVSHECPIRKHSEITQRPLICLANGWSGRVATDTRNVSHLGNLWTSGGGGAIS